MTLQPKRFGNHRRGLFGTSPRKKNLTPKSRYQFEPLELRALLAGNTTSDVALGDESLRCMLASHCSQADAPVSLTTLSQVAPTDPPAFSPLVTNPMVKIRLQVTDLSGNDITTIQQGQDFLLKAFVDDVRTPPETDPNDQGVFGTYINVDYNDDVATVATNATITFGTTYTDVHKSDTTVSGEIHNTGGLAALLHGPGLDELLLWQVQVHAQAAGTATFTAGMPTDPLLNITLYGEDNPIPADRIDFVGDSLSVTGLPSISISNPTIEEGDSGTSNLVFNLTLSQQSTDPITVLYETHNGTATAGSDYVAQTGTVSFAPNTTTQTITIAVNGDTAFEPTEGFQVKLSTPTNAVLDGDTASATITDNDGRLSVSDGEVVEDSGSPTAIVFHVTLNHASSAPLSVVYSTNDGTATAGQDYTATSDTLSFAAGETSKDVTVLISSDTVEESDETFNLTLSSPTGAVVTGTGIAIGTIRDNDHPVLTIAPVSHAEGNDQTTEFVFTATLSAASTQTLTFVYQTADDTATTADNDYQALPSTTVTFDPGETEKFITVLVNGDTKSENDEQFKIVGTLTNPLVAQPANVEGVGTIQDDPDVVPDVSISSPEATAEGNADTTNVVFTVTLSAASGKTITVAYQTQDGTATTADNDYTAQTNTLTFAPGETQKTITVAVNGDTNFEADETFTVGLGTVANATVETGTGTASITNDDAPPTVSIGDITHAEGDSETTDFVFTISLSNATTQEVSVVYQTSAGTATSPEDFEATSGTVTFAAGETTKTITVKVVGEMAFESDETFQVTLSDPVNAALADDPSATGTITNDDGVISVGNAQVVEGDDGTTALVFHVTLSHESTDTISVQYATVADTATEGTDYTAASGTLVFEPGEISKDVTVLVNGDNIEEADEALKLQLSAPSNGSIGGTGIATGTIQNDDLPVASIESVEHLEGNSETTAFVFTVTLTKPSSEQITFVYHTADDTATTADNDYQAIPSATVTFAPGETQKTITVLVNGDSKSEDNEQFKLIGTLNDPLATAPAELQATGTIQDDPDALPTISISSPTAPQAEGNANTTSYVFTVTLSAASGKTVTVGYATANGTATVADNDYAAVSGSLSFAPGETSKTITVLATGDTKHEADENFTVGLTAAGNATIETGTGTATINNDDAVPTVTINDPDPITEGNDGTVNLVFTVTLSNASSDEVTVLYATQDDTATTAGNDYVGQTSTITIAAGATTGTITIAVKGDTVDEANETFKVNLSSPQNATLAAKASGTGTITDDDTPPSLAVADVTQLEGDSGTTNFVFTVTLTGNHSDPVTVQYETADGTAKTPGDYAATSGALTFAAGVTTQTITVAVVGDKFDEGSESFFLNLKNVSSNATIGDGQATGTIQQEDSDNQLEAPSTITGFVYLDSDNNGIRDKVNERGIGGVSVRLLGTTLSGAPVDISVTTDGDGKYTFTNVRPGTYHITAAQDARYADGLDTHADQPNTAAANDDFFLQIGAAGNLSATEYNFGEHSFEEIYLSGRLLLASTPPSETLTLEYLKTGRMNGNDSDL